MSQANNLIGKTLSNRYEILRPLGEGGMGKVYLAKDKRFGKQVVVKVPTMEAGDKEFKDRFMREIASLATLEHLHIVTTVDWGEIEGIPFLVLRYLSGGSLRDRITDAQGYYKPMPLEGLNQWLPQIASALDFIHSKNWVHRDLKPDNILFDEAGNPYLADFGIAKALEGAPMGVKTTMGAFIGTPQYMAPEMHLGKGIGPRADQFGLAVLVYEALAGKIPFAGATPTAIFVEVMQGKAKPIHELVPGISLEKSNALMKGITKEPRDRYGSCVEFANAITGSMLARVSSAGSETLSRVVIPGTRMETPKKPDIPGIRIETPSKPEIAGTRIETPVPIPLAIPVSMPLEITGTRIETPSKPEIVGTRLEKSGSRQDIKLRSEDYLRSEGLLLEELCKNLVASGKVTKELFLAGRQFCKSNDVTGMPGGVLIAEKIESIIKTGHVSKEISQEVVSLARDILGLEKPAIAGTRMDTPSKPEMAGTRLARNEMKVPVGEETEEELPYAKGRKKNESIPEIVPILIIGAIILVFVLALIINWFSDGNVPRISLAEGIASIEKEMVLIPAGRFMMGDRGDKIQVTLTKPFYMGKYEVTQEQWEAVMGNNPSSSTQGAKLPVTDVSWNDCQEFIKKLNTKTSGGYRLPTEAEWEYACRAGTTTAYSVGDGLTKSDANIDGDSIKAVGSYKANAFGLYDMHGNVWEWCEDWYAPYPAGAVTDPKGPATESSRVFRGGSFFLNVSKARTSYRCDSTPTIWGHSGGFRLARTADIKAGASPTVPKPDPAMVMPTTGNLLVAPFTEVQKEVAKSLQKEVEEEVDLGQGIKLEMILIPSGKFMMGSPASEKDRRGNETQHEVTLTKPFYMAKHEVTQEQWEGVMGNNPSSRTKGTNLPVTNVSWEDCQEFIKKLNASTKGGYRLPYDAEWEYTCRAGTTTAYSYGDNLTKSDANIDGDSIKAVGSYRPNAFGVYDMHGNVWEWCENWFGSFEDGEVTDPRGPAKGESRVLRGGSFLNYVSIARSSSRYDLSPSTRDFNSGFRLVRTIDFKTAVVATTVPKPEPAVVMPASGNLLVAPFNEAKAKEVQKEVAKSLKMEVEEKVDLGKGIELELVLIPAGKVMMGSPASEEGRSADETQHEVIITKPYYMGKFEVTQEQWEALMGVNPSIIKGAKLPVTDVSWHHCQEFIKELNAKTKGGYRLPTEAEWEYACRAGTNTAYSYGENLTKSDANIYGSSKKAAGSYKANTFGLYDMHGNVWEWCEDWKADYPGGAVTDPKGPATGKCRVLRGGSFDNTVSFARSSLRLEVPPSYRVSDVGFRLAKTADSKAGASPTVPKPDPAEVMPATGNLLVAPFTEAKAKEVQKEIAKSLQKEVEEKEDLGKGIKLDMVLIPAGKFMMGSPASEKRRNADETQHEVTLTKPYYMGKYEVTQEQWENVIMGNNPSSRNKGAKLPVTNVSWENCQNFIKKLNAKTNGGYRLPTEAEWEHACKAGTTTAYSIGDILTKSDANYGDGTVGSIKAVGSYKPNAFGLYDMHGNVWEWCEDWYAGYPEGSVTDPNGPARGDHRMLRGGSFHPDASGARSSVRFFDLPSNYNYDYSPVVRTYGHGFRLARTP